jgi:hypothetical protein
VFFLRDQQVPFVVLLNLCSSTSIIIVFVHSFLVQISEGASLNVFEHLQQVFFNCRPFWFSREFSSPWFKPFVDPWLVTLSMILLFHYCCSLVVDLPDVLVVPLLLFFN